jgi:hypothetical protein
MLCENISLTKVQHLSPHHQGGEANEAQRAHLHQSREQWANYTDQERGSIIIQQKYNRAINEAFKANE